MKTLRDMFSLVFGRLPGDPGSNLLKCQALEAADCQFNAKTSTSLTNKLVH